MYSIKYILIALFSVILVSCTEESVAPTDELAGLLKVQEFSNDTHIVELYTKSGGFLVGHNKISLRIKNKATNQYETNAAIQWMPMMRMTMHDHSCPFSEVAKAAEKETVYEGHIVFQMPGNDMEGWNLTVNYTIGSTDYTAAGDIVVPNSARVRVSSVTGSDGGRYILALIEPSSPKVATNDLIVGLYKRETMMSFPPVADFKIQVDPRMPGMGNHGSPGNVYPVYNPETGLYHGKLSLTMTGYWKVNMILLNDTDEVLKGEAVTESNESSTLYFEVEF
jgi:hypothetical protein